MSRDVGKGSEVRASEQNLRPRISALPPRPAAARPPKPLPDVLLRAIREVARDFQLPANWLNRGPAGQWTSDCRQDLLNGSSGVTTRRSTLGLLTAAT